MKLQVLKHFNSQAQAKCYALVLGEVGGERQLQYIGATEAQSYGHRDERYYTARPLTHNLFTFRP